MSCGVDAAIFQDCSIAHAACSRLSPKAMPCRSGATPAARHATPAQVVAAAQAAAPAQGAAAPCPHASSAAAAASQATSPEEAVSTAPGNMCAPFGSTVILSCVMRPHHCSNYKACSSLSSCRTLAAPALHIAPTLRPRRASVCRLNHCRGSSCCDCTGLRLDPLVYSLRNPLLHDLEVGFVQQRRRLPRMRRRPLPSRSRHRRHHLTTHLRRTNSRRRPSRHRQRSSLLPRRGVCRPRRRPSLTRLRPRHGRRRQRSVRSVLFIDMSAGTNRIEIHCVAPRQGSETRVTTHTVRALSIANNRWALSCRRPGLRASPLILCDCGGVARHLICMLDDPSRHGYRSPC